MIRKKRPEHEPDRRPAPEDEALRDALDEGLGEEDAGEESEARGADLAADEVAEEEVREALEEGLSEEDTLEELEARAGGLPGTDQQVVPPPADPREAPPT